MAMVGTREARSDHPATFIQNDWAENAKLFLRASPRRHGLLTTA
jgi:hypothetical protein